MFSKNNLKAITSIAILVLLAGCSPGSTPETKAPVSTPTLTATESPTITTSNPGGPELLYTLSGHSGSVMDVVFLPGGEFLASSGRDLNIHLWDIRNEQVIHTFRMRSVDMADIDISGNGELLASAEAIWDLETRQELYVLERGSNLPAHVAFSPDGSQLALGLMEHQIILWNVAVGDPVFTFEQQLESRTKKMEFSPDGTTLAVGVIDGTVRLMDVLSGEIRKTLHYAGETDIHDLSFSPDGRFLATGGRVPAVVLWDVESGEVIRTFRLTDNSMSMDFSPNGDILATAGGVEFDVRLWDVENGSLLYSLPHPNHLFSIAFSPDGKLLAAACMDSNIYIWEMPARP